jgi:DNA-binding response OmpR family regulator
VSPDRRAYVAALSQIRAAIWRRIAEALAQALQVRAVARILLVEDEPELARLVVRELEATGYQVQHAADGQAALEQFAAQRPDLVVLDWMLPGMDGLAVLGRIRQSSPVPVLMLTARAEEVDRVIGLEVGADD